MKVLNAEKFEIPNNTETPCFQFKSQTHSKSNLNEADQTLKGLSAQNSIQNLNLIQSGLS